MVTVSSTSLSPTPSLSCRIPSSQVKRLICHCCLSDKPKHRSVLSENESCPSSQHRFSRRMLVSFLVSPLLFPTLSSFAKTKAKNPYDERRLLEQNKRIQRENNAPEDFPNFIREGFEVKVVTSDNYVKLDSGLIYRDFKVGEGDFPKDGQQVVFHYIGYNESGRRIDSTYIQGSPARIRLGTNALVPGFEMGIRDMRPGGRRRIIIPPELGPPVSSKAEASASASAPCFKTSERNCKPQSVICFDRSKSSKNVNPLAQTRWVLRRFSARSSLKFSMWSYSASRIARGEQ